MLTDRKESLDKILSERGLSRRDFIQFCSVMAGVLLIPFEGTKLIASALENSLLRKPSLVWLEFQSCTADTESLLRASRPSVVEIVLDLLSVDYHETIMAAAGKQAEEALMRTLEGQKGKYIAVIEGSIPRGENGIYCVIGGKTALQRAQEACKNAFVTIAAGTCSAFGGIARANPNPTDACPVSQIVPEARIINLPGCPVNVVNLTATVVHILTFNDLPQMDSLRRPLFAYGKRIHDNCERRAHFDAGQFVERWGDEGHRKGWCLYKMGCKGPAAFMNCPTVRWNEGTNWPVGCGHPCLACGMPDFWDEMSPFYERLPDISVGGVETTADTVGIIAAAGVGAIMAAHGVGKYIEYRARKKQEKEQKGDDKDSN